MFGINFAAGELLADDGVSEALSLGGSEMERGVMKRIIDYDKNYGLKKYSRSKIERAVLALYIFSKELDTPGYGELASALKLYSSNNGISANFAKVDASLQRVGGRLQWNP